MHSEDIGDYFRVYPAYQERFVWVNRLPPGYEYRSDRARQLSVDDLRRLISQPGQYALEVLA